MNDTLTVANEVQDEDRRVRWAKTQALLESVGKEFERAAKTGGAVSPIWPEVSGKGSELDGAWKSSVAILKKASTELQRLKRHEERQKYLVRNQEMLLEQLRIYFATLQALLQYNTLRMSNISLTCEDPANAEALLQSIAGYTRELRIDADSYAQEILTSLSRELFTMARLQGERTRLPFSKRKAAAEEVRTRAEQTLSWLEGLAGPSLIPTGAAEPIAFKILDTEGLSDPLLDVIRRRFDPHEVWLGLAEVSVARHRFVRLGSMSPTSPVAARAANALRRVSHVRTLLVLTSDRLLLADLAEFQRDGTFVHEVEVNHVGHPATRRLARGIHEVVLLVAGEQMIQFETPSFASSQGSKTLVDTIHGWARNSSIVTTTELTPHSDARASSVSPDAPQDLLRDASGPSEGR